MGFLSRAESASLSVAAGMLLTATTGFATVIPGGNIIGNETWTVAGSPYDVLGDVTIPVGASLTIDAGVLVNSGPSDLQAGGVDVNFVEFIVEGSLNVNGTCALPVEFSSNGGWYGIRELPGATVCQLTDVRIRGAFRGVTHAGSVLDLENVDIDDCGVDLDMTGGGAYTLQGTIRGSRFVGAITFPSGVRWEHNGGPAGTAGGLTMAPGSTYAATVRGPFDSDRMFVIGTVTLDGTLELDVSASTVAVGDSVPLMINDGVDPIVGTFASHPEGTFIPTTGFDGLVIDYSLGGGQNDLGLRGTTLVGVEPGANVRTRRITGIRPNPSDAGQVIRLELPSVPANARIEVFDLLGRSVRRLAVLPASGGVHEVAWDGRDAGGRTLPAGLYLVRLVIDGVPADDRPVVRVR